MAKSSDQKLKILYLISFFFENTDETHPASMADIIEYLGNHGISAERKSIYSDIERLRIAGYDIINRKEYPAGYYMASRDFELAELKLLVDAVQSSKFITEKKSNALISKIEKLTSKYQGRKLQRQVYVTNRVKTSNEAILYNIDYINEAIADGFKIKFQYGEWNLNKELVPRKNSKFYLESPVILMWDDENYYLVAYDEQDNKIKHFRVDKMLSISVTNEKITRNNITSEFDAAIYAREHFGMFTGHEDTVSVRFTNNLVGVVIDRFGRDVTLIKEDDKHFKARFRVQVSNQFFGWLSGFGGNAVIEGPENVRNGYIKFIEDIRKAL